MFALLMEPYAMIQVSTLLQLHRAVVGSFVPGNSGLFRRNPWQPLAEPRLKNTGVNLVFMQTFRLSFCDVFGSFASCITHLPRWSAMTHFS